MTVINEITRADVSGFRDDWSVVQNALDEYQRIATKSAIYPGKGTPLGLIYVALKGCGEAGEFAEHVGKAMRDDDMMTRARDVREPVILPERRAALIKELGDRLWYISAAANELGLTLSEVALANLEKLCDRTERDALRGSGDER